MNKSELVEALVPRLGDRKLAARALDAVLAEIQTAVTKGDRVAIAGFGVFERRVRTARTARNPRTGEPIRLPRRSVPVFRPGASFKAMVAAGGSSRARGGSASTEEALARITRAAKAPVRGGKVAVKAIRPPPGPGFPTER